MFRDLLVVVVLPYICKMPDGSWTKKETFVALNNILYLFLKIFIYFTFKKYFYLFLD